MQTATITSKRQLTLPSVLYRQANLREGQKVRIAYEGGKIVIEPMANLIEALAGSVTLPARWRGKSVDEIVGEAKKKRFKKRFSIES